MVEPFSSSSGGTLVTLAEKSRAVETAQLRQVEVESVRLPCLVEECRGVGDEGLLNVRRQLVPRAGGRTPLPRRTGRPGAARARSVNGSVQGAQAARFDCDRAGHRSARVSTARPRARPSLSCGGLPMTRRCRPSRKSPNTWASPATLAILSDEAPMSRDAGGVAVGISRRWLVDSDGRHRFPQIVDEVGQHQQIVGVAT